jgi:ferric iron reductase protein FhuF
VAELVDAVGAWLPTAERRVTASMVVLGYAARLLGPGIAILLRNQILLDLRPHQVHYSYRPEQGFRLTLTRPAGWRGTPEALSHQWRRHVLDAHLARVIDAVRRVVPVAAGLLWGNVASGLAGALHTLAEHGGVPLDECHTTALALLGHGPLRDSGHLTIHDTRLAFRRRSCCLYYRLDGAGTCGDCPLG